eukprot:GHVH01013619.1.p1 GENE.GHVH01013619.1~~GHVH01013619.1.p1  ORF type:complete len:176 (+),score=18.00 GHVH01013619.1:371-898(+)
MREYLSGLKFSGEGSIKNVLRELLSRFISHIELVDLILMLLPSQLSTRGPVSRLRVFFIEYDWLAMPSGMTAAAIAESFMKYYSLKLPNQTKVNDLKKSLTKRHDVEASHQTRQEDHCETFQGLDEWVKHHSLLFDNRLAVDVSEEQNGKVASNLAWVSCSSSTSLNQIHQNSRA